MTSQAFKNFSIVFCKYFFFLQLGNKFEGLVDLLLDLCGGCVNVLVGDRLVVNVETRQRKARKDEERQHPLESDHLEHNDDSPSH